MSIQIKMIGILSLQGGAGGVHGLLAVHGDMTFSIAGEESLQQEPAGEVVFHQKRPQGLIGRPGLLRLAGAQAT
jgi:hypothetical protein